jgi:outer membrane murein-binding lipoprotein Lpp
MRSLMTILSFAVLPAALFVAGCMSSSISDPASPDYNPSTTAIRETLNPSPSLPPQPFVASGARRSGNFPAFGRPPATANNQITPLQREILQAELAAARAEQQADRAAAARYRQRLAELQTLARTHGGEARRQIEN